MTGNATCRRAPCKPFKTVQIAMITCPTAIAGIAWRLGVHEFSAEGERGSEICTRKARPRACC